MSNVKSLTVAQLIKELKKQPQDFRVFISSDPEGNSFGNLQADYMVGGSNEDKVVILYPDGTHLHDEVMPLEMDGLVGEL